MAKKDMMQKEMSKAYKTGKKEEVSKIESRGMKKAMAKKKK